MKSTTQKMKFSIKDFFSKCDQIRRKLHGKLHFLCSKIRKYLHLEKENFNETLFNCVVPINLHVLQKKINILDSKDLL